jgi:hypothetical protein
MGEVEALMITAILSPETIVDQVLMNAPVCHTGDVPGSTATTTLGR